MKISRTIFIRTCIRMLLGSAMLVWFSSLNQTTLMNASAESVGTQNAGAQTEQPPAKSAVAVSANSKVSLPTTVTKAKKASISETAYAQQSKSYQSWWTEFHDSHLNTYVNAALQNSPTLNASLERITEAKALVQEGIAGEMPTINLNPSFYRVGLPSSATAGLPIPSTLYLYSLPLSASYEPDIWGRKLNGVQSARKKLESARLQSRSLANTLTGEVASAYINLLRCDDLIRLQQDNLDLLQHIATLKISLHQGGLLSNDEVLRAQRDASQAVSDLETTRQQQAVFAHQLSILTGSSPTSVDNIQRGRLEDLNFPQTISSDWAETFLSGRPDVEAQEKLLESAHIDVTVAKKDLLPTFNVSAMLGVASLELSHLLNFQQNFLSLLSIGMNQPLFDGGKRFAEIKLRNAMQKEQMENYRQTLLSAMKDVADSLATVRANTNILNNSQERLSLTQKDLDLSNSLYQQGLAPHLNVLEQQGEVVRYQELIVQGQADKAIAMVSLYKALGGGF